MAGSQRSRGVTPARRPTLSGCGRVPLGAAQLLRTESGRGGGLRSRGRGCPIPAVRPPPAALLLCCLQDSIAWLAPCASSAPSHARGLPVPLASTAARRSRSASRSRRRPVDVEVGGVPDVRAANPRPVVEADEPTAGRPAPRGDHARRDRAARPYEHRRVGDLDRGDKLALGCGTDRPRTRPWLPRCSPISWTGGWTSSKGCCSSSTDRRGSGKPSGRCSATTCRSNAVLSTSSATCLTISPSATATQSSSTLRASPATQVRCRRG